VALRAAISSEYILISVPEWQLEREDDMGKSKESGFTQYDFVEPRSWTNGRKAGQPTVIIIHTTEGSEGPNSAENGAAYDTRRKDGTSTHFFVDSNSVVQCVRTDDEAHTARAHGNDVGIQIEVCGKAGQSKTQWADVFSAATIQNVAELCVVIRKKYGRDRFPLVNLTPSQLRDGDNGFAEHYDATKAWPGDKGSHTDPGPNFPWSKLFSTIQELEKAAPAAGKRKVIMEPIIGALPILKAGDTDPIDKSGWSHVKRAQRLLSVEADGIYGPNTIAAVKKLGETGDGKTINAPIWKRLIGLRKPEVVTVPPVTPPPTP
jgi:N-acetyl-anhydromuramyl-L-alanine amidase AmpD